MKLSKIIVLIGLFYQLNSYASDTFKCEMSFNDLKKSDILVKLTDVKSNVGGTSEYTGSFTEKIKEHNLIVTIKHEVNDKNLAWSYYTLNFNLHLVNEGFDMGTINLNESNILWKSESSKPTEVDSVTFTPSGSVNNINYSVTCSLL